MENFLVPRIKYINKIFLIEGLLYPEKVLNSRNRPGQEPLSAESIAAFKNQPPGRLWYGEGCLQDVRVFLIRPLFPGAFRTGEILCLRRLTREGSS